MGKRDSSNRGNSDEGIKNRFSKSEGDQGERKKNSGKDRSLATLLRQRTQSNEENEWCEEGTRKELCPVNTSRRNQ